MIWYTYFTLGQARSHFMHLYYWFSTFGLANGLSKVCFVFSSPFLTSIERNECVLRLNVCLNAHQQKHRISKMAIERCPLLTLNALIRGGFEKCQLVFGQLSHSECFVYNVRIESKAFGLVFEHFHLLEHKIEKKTRNEIVRRIYKENKK